MKAQDLRIGNFVFIGEVQQVVDVLCDSVNTEKHKNMTYENVESISLTEDWLLKFG